MTSAQYDFYPPGLAVFVNGSYVSLPKLVGNKIYQPIDVTQYIMQSAMVENRVVIMRNDDVSNYVVTVSLAKQLSPDTLFSLLQPRVPQFTLAMSMYLILKVAYRGWNTYNLH